MSVYLRCDCCIGSSRARSSASSGQVQAQRGLIDGSDILYFPPEGKTAWKRRAYYRLKRRLMEVKLTLNPAQVYGEV